MKGKPKPSNKKVIAPVSQTRANLRSLFRPMCRYHSVGVTLPNNKGYSVVLLVRRELEGELVEPPLYALSGAN